MTEKMKQIFWFSLVASHLLCLSLLQWASLFPLKPAWHWGCVHSAASINLIIIFLKPVHVSTAPARDAVCAFVSALIVSLIKSGFSGEYFYVRQLDWKPPIWIDFSWPVYDQSASFVESFDKKKKGTCCGKLNNISTTRQVREKSFLYPWLALARDYFNNTVSSSIATGQ